MSLKIVVHCCNYLFGEGIKLIIEECELNIDEVVNCFDRKEIIEERPDLLVADFNTICSILHDTSFNHNVRLLLLETGCLPRLENERLLDFIRGGLVGILASMTDSSQFKKSIKNALSGDFWLERKKLQSIIATKSGAFSNEKPDLTEKELEIVKLICNGFSNKEIMKKLKISEQSVKSRLRRIYRKTGVSSRLQLALFAVNTNQAMFNQMSNKSFDREL